MVPPNRRSAALTLRGSGLGAEPTVFEVMMLTPRCSRRQLALVSLLLLAATASCGGDDEKPAEGTEGGSCYGNGTCDDGLACLSNKCVDPGGNEPTTPGAGFDVSACFDCGAESCAAEAEKCDGAGACGTLLNCALDCAGDVSCASDCATTTSVTTEEQSAMVAYQACLVTKCLDACTPEVNVPSVQPTSTPTSPAPGQPPASVAEACLGCGDAQCTAEANACDDSNACSTILSCGLECGSDATCASNCLAGITLTADDQTALVAYQSCLATACLDECSFEGSVTPGTTPVTPGTPVTPVTPPAGTPTASAEACSVVKPPETCVQAEAFVLAEDGTDLVGVATPTFNELVIAAGGVTGDWVLESGQLGVLQFEFSAPIDPARVALEGSLSDVEFVTLEDASGSGCQYYLSAGRLQRYTKSTDGLIDWYGCWGDYETYETSEPSTLTIINIRTGVSSLNEAHAITVTSMLL